MRQFDQFLDYKLLKGSHDFPGEAGGACLNEVAVVAAGFDYRSVKSAGDCPPCFSRVISAYVIGLNDAMPDDARQELKRFVLRLAGSADSAGVERERAEFLVLETVRRVLPIALRAVGLLEQARRCAGARDLCDAEEAAVQAVRAATTWAAREATTWAARAATTWAARAATTWAVQAARAAAVAAAAEAATTAKVWLAAVSILDDVLKIGARAPELDESCVETRLRAVFGERAAA